MQNSERPPHKFAENIVHFARLLRSAGVPIGPAQTLKSVEAACCVGIRNRHDFYWALHTSLINTPEHSHIFDDAFRCFWRNPEIMQRMMAMMLPTLPSEGNEKTQQSARRRLIEAMQGQEEAPPSVSQKDSEIEFDAAMSMSAAKGFASKDFADMSLAEMREAREAICKLSLPFPQMRTRRYRHRGDKQIDRRASLREIARVGDAALPIMRQQRLRPPPLVALCDISGSMDRYARMILHFMHQLCITHSRIHVFVFGTCLTNVTRDLARKDPDEALERISEHVKDWSGGTHIGASLRRFNRDWSRRVLGQRAALMLITDGLERENTAELEVEMDRLHKSCSRLLWLNPLLRFDKYAPLAQGAKVMIRHVDEFRPIHNLNSLAMLADALQYSHKVGDVLKEMRSHRG